MIKIDIKGIISSDDNKWVYEWLGYSAVCPKDVLKALKDANGQEVEVDINSGGGDIFAGSEMYTAIRSYKGNKQINIVGLAASAASVVAMAAKCLITPTGMFMVHNVSSGAQGDYHDMEHSAEVLKIANQSIANAYKEKTGLSDEELLAIMDKETWMSAEEVVKNKFVDGVMFQNQLVNQQKSAFYNSTQVVPLETIEKIRNTIKKPLTNGQQNDGAIQNGADFLVLKAQTQLNLLKLKGEPQ